MKRINPRNNRLSLQTECHTCPMLGSKLQRSNIINELPSTQAAAFKSHHSRQQMVARVPSATITMQDEDWKDFHFQMHTRESCSIYSLLVFFLGPTGQHTVTNTLAWSPSFALYFLTFCNAYAQKYPCINRYFFFLFLWVMLCITMY